MAQAKNSKELFEGIVRFIHHTFFKRDNGIICDLDIFWTNVRAALCDVAKAYAICLSQLFEPILSVERMHLQRSDMNKHPWTTEHIMEVMFAENVAYILAEKTFYAFPELLDTIYVFLRHPPGPIFGVRWSRLEFLDLLLHAIVP